MNSNLEVGNIGEDLACKYLISHKFKILFRNFKEKFDEIDIISKSSDRTLVFVEVKTLRGFQDGSLGLIPEDQLTFQKFHKISRACALFAAKHSNLINPKKGWRIDLIAINLGEDRTNFQIRHYENVL
ncbi:MAG: YraN family protein [Patescibacteria group bacterium]|nr:YraN family protein [Patescibacteria group bacterium]